ncbi:hypothetical protein E2C01_042927 [Portunus trituberculatus]|uniref:Uncharacterized protein n=1 Tax=Portunus trituberculatus TaxID=210409 RepID=A0A5B7FVZ2_PORTR|nr:hypothetical protein [Portunus trituberculatus]
MGVIGPGYCKLKGRQQTIVKAMKEEFGGTLLDLPSVTRWLLGSRHPVMEEGRRRAVSLLGYRKL